MIPEKSIAKLRVERLVDQTTGRATPKYFWDDKPIPAVELAGDHAVRMSGLALIQKDLANALRWVDKASQLLGTLSTAAEGSFVRLENREVADDIKAFFVAALVFYAKAFTEATGRRAQMSRDWLDEEFRVTHDYYMSFRHNMAAHSGDEKLEEAHSYLLLIPVARNRVDVRVHTNRAQPDFALHGGRRQELSRIDQPRSGEGE